MRRDMDLVREILLFVEENIPDGEQVAVEISGRSAAEVNYHIKLLHEAEFIEAIDTSSSDGDDWIVQRLTWKGHDFAEAARSNVLWAKAKQLIVEKGSALTVDAIFAALKIVAVAAFTAAAT